MRASTSRRRRWWSTSAPWSSTCRRPSSPRRRRSSKTAAISAGTGLCRLPEYRIEAKQVQPSIPPPISSVGIMTSREDETACSIEVEFHDAQAHRPVRMLDHFGYTMAALSEHAIVLASPTRIPTEEDKVC